MKHKHKSLIRGLAVGCAASLLTVLNAAAVSYGVSNWVVDTSGQTRAISVGQIGTTTSFVNATNAAVAASQFFGNSTIGSSPTTLTLANIGDQISLTGTATFIGGGTYGNTQWRIGLFYRDNRLGVNTGIQGTNWLGYFVGAGQGTASSFYERIDPNTGMYASGTGASVALSGNNPGVNFDAGVYDLTFNILYSAANTLQFNFSIIEQAGGSSYSSISATITDASPSTYSFDRVGMLSGGSVSATEIRYDNLTVNYTPVPEPASLALAVLGLAGVIGFRRRAGA
jgi:hypothetical protein